MSRSNPTELENKHPVSKWIEYKDGTYEYWDKEIVNEDGSQGARVNLGEKIAFLYVAHTFSLSGFNNDEHSYMTSNEVFSVTEQPFELRTMSNKVLVNGIWGENKPLFKATGCKFGINLYALVKIKGEYVKCCIKTHGGNYGAWNEFITILGGATKEQIDKLKKDKKRVSYTYSVKGYQKVETGAVLVNEHREDKFGKVTFNVPVFQFLDKVSEEANNSAIEFDKELQAFLKAKIAEAPVAEKTPKQAPKEELSDEEMFGEKAPSGNAAPTPPTAGDEPFNDGLDDLDDDLPF